MYKRFYGGVDLVEVDEEGLGFSSGFFGNIIWVLGFIKIFRSSACGRRLVMVFLLGFFSWMGVVFFILNFFGWWRDRGLEYF